jgi:serine/threonine protein kinase
MEYIDGISLADRRQPILSETEAIRYIQQIGEALIVVHQERLIHRDIHPGNIFLRVRQGKSEAVLIDFGLALEFDSVLTTKRAKQTSEGFTPLELYAQHTRPTGAYSDIYSLAATLYVLLTGKMPVSALQRKIRKTRLVAPKKYNPQISDRTNRAILTGMELESQKRSQSMREWLDLLGLSSLARKLYNTPLIQPKQINPSISKQLNRVILKGMALEAKQRPQSMQAWLQMLEKVRERKPNLIHKIKLWMARQIKTTKIEFSQNVIYIANQIQQLRFQDVIIMTKVFPYLHFIFCVFFNTIVSIGFTILFKGSFIAATFILIIVFFLFLRFVDNWDYPLIIGLWLYFPILIFSREIAGATFVLFWLLAFMKVFKVELINKFSQFNTFLILVFTSGIGLYFGWLVLFPFQISNIVFP